MRGHSYTYFVTTVAADPRALFQGQQNAQLMTDVLFRYRDQGRYALHAFVVMPDHIHLMLSPSVNESIERCVQCIKGGYSFALRSKGSIWQKSFYEHRLRNYEDYARHIAYIEQNPVRCGWHEHPHVHTRYLEKLDRVPLCLKEL